MSVQINRAFEVTSNSVKIEVFESGYASLGKEWKFEDMCSPFSRLYYVISGSGYLRLHPSEAVSEGMSGEPAGGLQIVEVSGEPAGGPQTGVGKGTVVGIYQLRPGYVYLIPNGLSYDCFCEEYLEKVYIHINVRLGSGLELFNGCSRYYELPVSEGLLQQMKEWMTSGRVEDYFHLQGEIYHAVGRFAEAAGISDKVNRRYSKMVTGVFELLQQSRMSATVQELAEGLSVSESTLAKNFRKETGMSIGMYREQLIMSRARQLLASGKLPIGEIAEELGFCDQFYFSRYFKQRQGMMPRRYRAVTEPVRAYDER